MIVSLAVLAYFPCLRGGFILDDDQLVTNSPLIQRPDGLYHFWFTTQPVDFWPLTNTSFWIEWRLWGLKSTGYHVTNLLLHIASALLMWKILNMLSIPGAWLAALLFAVHPVNVESVAWISQRKNTLSMLFFLLSILWYLKADNGMGLRRERSAERRWYWLSLLAFILAMLSKGSVAVLPLILLLLAWWQRGSVTKWDLSRSAPFFLVAVALAVVNVWFQTHGSDVEVRSAGFIERLLGAGAVVWFYLYKALAPVNLLFIYPQWNIEATNWLWWIPLLAGLAVTAVLLWQRHSRFGRPLLFSWLFFCIALAPVMGFTDVGFMKYSLVADRYLHIALLGVVALVAAGWATWRRQSQHVVRMAATATAIVVICSFGYLSWQQSALYTDGITLYEATLAKNPDCWLLRDNLGSALTGAGRLREAIDQHHRALQLEPQSYKSHNNLGFTLKQSGRVEEAIAQYQQALRINSDYAIAHNNLGVALKQVGRLEQAIKEYQQALQLQPDYAAAHSNLGAALRQAGQLEEGIEHLQQALRLNPYFPEAESNLGNALQSAGRLDEAIVHYQRALELHPDFFEARFNLGQAFAQSGRYEDAIAQYQEALRVPSDSKRARIYAGLAMACAQANRPEQAIAAAQRGFALARSTGQTGLAQQIEAWLTAYRAGQQNRGDRSGPPVISPPGP